MGFKTAEEKEAAKNSKNEMDEKLTGEKAKKDARKAAKKERKGPGYGQMLKNGIGKSGSAIKGTVFKLFKYLFYIIIIAFLLVLPGFIYMILVYLVIRKLVKGINIL